MLLGLVQPNYPGRTSGLVVERGGLKLTISCKMLRLTSRNTIKMNHFVKQNRIFMHIDPPSHGYGGQA